MNNCTTCQWAEWQMTKHAKPRVKEAAGRCRYFLPEQPLPEWAAGARIRQDDIAREIWPDDPYLHCSVWEQKVQP